MKEKYKSEAGEKIKETTDKILQSNNIKNQGLKFNFVGIAFLGGSFLIAFTVIFFWFSSIESNFLKDTLGHEEKFKPLAQKCMSISTFPLKKQKNYIKASHKRHQAL